MENNSETKKDIAARKPEEQGDFQRLFWMHLLFGKEVEKPAVERIKAVLSERFGDVDVVSGDEELGSFALKRFPVTYSDGVVPAQVMIAEVTPFEQESITPLERTQLWNVQNSGELLSECSHRLMISDFMASGLPYKERCELLMGWLDTAMDLFPDCRAVWIPTAGKLLTAEQVRSCTAQGGDRFIYVGVNARFFNIEGTEESLVDTLGLYAIGLPDVQYHYRGLDPNQVVNHAYNAASYIFENDAPIKSGETIDGIESDDGTSRGPRWICQYEMSLLKPSRELMDICPGEFAAGNRNPE